MAYKPKLLLVDDSVYTVSLIQAILGTDYQIVSAYSGPDAMEMLHAGCSAPDGMLLDVFMPHMDGYELLAELRSHHEYQKIPAVIVSGHYDALDCEKALSLRICGFVSKPFTRTEILGAVDYMCRLSAALKQTSRVDQEPAKDYSLK